MRFALFSILPLSGILAFERESDRRSRVHIEVEFVSLEIIASLPFCVKYYNAMPLFSFKETNLTENKFMEKIKNGP